MAAMNFFFFFCSFYAAVLGERQTKYSNNTNAVLHQLIAKKKQNKLWNFLK
jgi:hypothetical protein